MQNIETLLISKSHVAGNYVLPTIRPPFGVDDLYVISEQDNVDFHIPFPIVTEARGNKISVIDLRGLINDKYDQGNPSEFLLRRRGGEIPYHTALIELGALTDYEEIEVLIRPYIKASSMFYATVLTNKYIADATTLEYLIVTIATMQTNRYFPDYSNERKINLVTTLTETTSDYVEANYFDGDNLDALLVEISNNKIVEERVAKTDSLEIFNLLFGNLVNTQHRNYLLAGIESLSAFASITVNYIDNTQYNKTPFIFTAKKIRKQITPFTELSKKLVDTLNKRLR